MISQTTPFRIRCHFLVRLLILAGGSALLTAGAAAGFEELGHWPSAPWRESNDLHVHGDLAYLGTGQGLMILDISNPTRPKYMSHLDCVAGGTTDVYAADDHVYLASGAQALRIVDVSDPAVPALVGELDVSNDWINAIFVRGDFAFLSHGNGLGRALVNPPDSPLYGGRYLDVAAWGRMQMVGDLGYLSTLTGLQIVDLSNLSLPTLLGSVEVGARAEGVAVQGDFAYLPMADGLHVIEVSDPDNPVERGVYTTSNGVGAVRVVGETAYVCVGTATQSVIQALNLVSPAEPSLLGEFPIKGGRPAMEVHLDHVLLISSYSGVKRMDIVDFTDPSAPVWVAAWENPGSVRDLSVSGEAVSAACDAGGLKVIDTTDAASPQVVGSYVPVGGASTLCVEQEGNTVGLGGSDAFRILDLSVPSQPELRGTYWPMMGAVQLMDIVGDRAYLVTGFGMGEFEVLDIVDPTAPVRLGGTSIFFDAADLEVAPNGVAFMAAGLTDLQLFDTGQGGDPTSLPSYGAVPGVYALEVRTEGEDLLVYLAGQDGLAIVQFNDPAQPQLVGQWVQNGANLGAVALSGDRAYVANTQQLWALDIAEPSSPSAIAETPIVATELGASENRVYAVTSDGMVILQLGGSITAPRLEYQAQEGVLVLDWSGAGGGAWVLQGTSDLLNAQGWENVTGSELATEWQPAMDASLRFFRLAPAAQ